MNLQSKDLPAKKTPSKLKIDRLFSTFAAYSDLDKVAGRNTFVLI